MVKKLALIRDPRSGDTFLTTVHTKHRDGTFTVTAPRYMETPLLKIGSQDVVQYPVTGKTNG